MKAASIKELRAALELLTEADLRHIVHRFARFRKENKELLTYLLFDARNEEQYVADIKAHMDEEFTNVHPSNPYYAKKTIRKILRQANRFTNYSESDQTTVEVLLYFLEKMRELKINIKKTQVLVNMYQSQLKKINKLVDKMHEDLQYDYRRLIKSLD
jgi:DNA repair photolyase